MLGDEEFSEEYRRDHQSSLMTYILRESDEVHVSFKASLENFHVEISYRAQEFPHLSWMSEERFQKVVHAC